MTQEGTGRENGFSVTAAHLRTQGINLRKSHPGAIRTNQETKNLYHLLYPHLVQLLALDHWLKKRLVKNLLMAGDVNLSFLNFFSSLAFHFPLCMSVLYT